MWLAELIDGGHDPEGKIGNGFHVIDPVNAEIQVSGKSIPGKVVNIGKGWTDYRDGDQQRQSQSFEFSPEENPESFFLKRWYGEITGDEKQHRHEKHIEDQDDDIKKNSMRIRHFDAPPRYEIAVRDGRMQNNDQQHHEITQIIEEKNAAGLCSVCHRNLVAREDAVAWQNFK